jgi:hypothetical protein
MISKELADFVSANEKDFEIHYFNEKKPFIRCLGSGHEFTNPTVAQLEAHRQSKKFKLKVLRAAVDYSQYEPYIVATREPHLLWCKLTRQYINKIPHEIEAHIKGRRYQVALTRANAGDAKIRNEDSESSGSEEAEGSAEEAFSSGEEGSEEGEDESSDGLHGSQSQQEESASDSDDSDMHVEQPHTNNNNNNNNNNTNTNSNNNNDNKQRKQEPASGRNHERSHDESKNAKRSTGPAVELSPNDIFSIVHRPFKGQENVNDLVAMAAKNEPQKEEASKLNEFGRRKFGENDDNDELDSEDGDTTTFDRQQQQKIYLGANVEDDDGEFEVVPESDSTTKTFAMDEDSADEQPSHNKNNKQQQSKNKNKKKNKNKNKKNQIKINAKKSENSANQNASNSNQKRKFRMTNNNNSNNNTGGSKKPKF